MSPPPPSGRPRDPAVDERIVYATRSLLYEGGLDAVSIAAVADRAGVGRPTVYRRYPDRDTLALAVLFADLQGRLEGVLESVPDDGPIVDQLVAMARPFLAYYSERPLVSAALLRLAMFSPSPWKENLSGQLMGYLGWVGGRIAAAQARGELDAEADVAVFANTFFALYITTAIGGVQGHFATLEDQVETFRAMITQHVTGLRPR